MPCFFPAVHSSSGSEVRNEGGTRRSYISTHTALAKSVTKFEIKQVVVTDGCGHRGKSGINGKRIKDSETDLVC